MTKTIKKILIANRGEIACRVIKTARKMGIATVAVYSDADRKALHVRMADEAVHIGPSPAVESYLVIDKLIAAAKKTGADAVHPGYGFLSENPDFVRACEKAGITFIGPAAESMEAMGLKDAAKKLMDAAGVPITPGYHGEDQSPKLLKVKAGMIGFPVLIKAVAGGGGKGMRKVEAEKDFDAALASCQREAKSSFGNDDVLIEKYIQSPRHIEVQVFGDTHGNVVHMFERDCSLQRRHQKVIEEAPAPGMTEEVRAAMTQAAVEAAKAVNYVGAGTVEFIVDGSGKLRKDGFWFMEMNTRLQVEHPVTEMITGLDLVEWQIRVAQGEKLPNQDEIKMEGHAVEARLYAEDPANDFLPTIGRIYSYDPQTWKSGDDEYRVDTGVEQEDFISIYYDPMIAKVIALAETRTEAIDNLKYLIDEVEVTGIKSNSAFLYQCLSNEDFLSEKVSTHFIPKNIEELIPEDFSQDDRVYGLAALFIEQKFKEKSETPFVERNGWRLNLPRNQKYRFSRNGEPVIVKIIESMYQSVLISVDDKPAIRFDYGNEDESLENSEVLHHYSSWAYRIHGDHISLFRQGQIVRVEKEQFGSDALVSSGDALTASMPGKIIAVNATVGDAVKAGDSLIVMEAMKMEMTLEAPRDGVVAEVNYETGALVSDGEILLTLEDEDK
jgi:3-methylcrotonyl-CoA carboxylase alpha subunit